MKKIIKFLPILLASIFGGFLVAAIVTAWSNPTQNPPGGDPSFWRVSGSNVYYNVLNGNVGIGTESPQWKLDIVGGSIRADGYIRGGQLCISDDCRSSWTGGYEIVTASGNDYNAPPITVYCSAGKKVIGGGCNMQSATADLRGSWPTGNNSWTCRSGSGGDLIVYAICAYIQ